MKSRRILITAAMAVGSLGMLSAQSLEFSGQVKKVLQVVPEKITGLDYIYVTYGSENLTASFRYSGTEVPRWYRYSNLGGGFAEEIRNIENNGGESILADIRPGFGYIIECGDKRYYYYIVDYLSAPLQLNGLIPAPEESDCTRTVIRTEGTGDPLIYYTINGQQRHLDRELTLEYETEEWSDTDGSFVKRMAQKSLPDYTTSISLTPPAYCSSYFTLTGDCFLRQWGEEQSVESSVMAPVAVDVRATAEQPEKDSSNNDDEESVGSNEISSQGGELGGSAPASIEFRAFTTEGVIHNEWQMATDAEFENITYRITDRNLDYTFMDEGTVYVRFVGSNSDGSCEAYSDVFTVSIGASELHCPNAFSPGASEGVNDEWKVSYKSLVDFKCWIFDRYGNQMCYFDDPQKGWDGKYRGKLVKPGVYYYVIQATGAEGKKYKKSGDINIVRYRTFSNGSSSE